MKQHIITSNNRNYLILIGENAKENWKIIDESDNFDLWLHIDDKASCHVIIKEILNKNNAISLEYPRNVVIEASKYCKIYSNSKDDKIKIVYTIIKNITKGKVVGEVYVSNEEYIIL